MALLVPYSLEQCSHIPFVFFKFFFLLILVRNSFLSPVISTDFELVKNSRLIIHGGDMNFKYQARRELELIWLVDPTS